MKKQRRVRSPRFVVPNNEQAVVSIGDEKLKGTLHMLSLTGGTIRLQRRFASGTFADIRIETASGTFSAAIELLPMASGNAQAFRFIAMGPVARGRLNDGLSKMRAQGLAIEKTPLEQFRSLARRVLSSRSPK
jgi:PilZ domain-containing protein